MMNDEMTLEEFFAQEEMKREKRKEGTLGDILAEAHDAIAAKGIVCKLQDLHERLLQESKHKLIYARQVREIIQYLQNRYKV